MVSWKSGNSDICVANLWTIQSILDPSLVSLTLSALDTIIDSDICHFKAAPISHLYCYSTRQLIRQFEKALPVHCVVTIPPLITY